MLIHRCIEASELARLLALTFFWKMLRVRILILALSRFLRSNNKPAGDSKNWEFGALYA